MVTITTQGKVNLIRTNFNSHDTPSSDGAETEEKQDHQGEAMQGLDAVKLPAPVSSDIFAALTKKICPSVIEITLVGI